MYVVYYMDNNVTNPFQVWRNGGSPATPDTNLFHQMRLAEVENKHQDHWQNLIEILIEIVNEK